MFQLPRRGALVLALALSPLPLHAQGAAGRISGNLRDALGAAVPGATVTLTEQTTGASQTVSSTAEGRYSVSLPPGVYSVSVTLRGFGSQTRKDLKLDAGAELTADFSLEAKREEEVTVTAMKREETIHDTPFSVAAPTEADLRERGVDDIEGVSRNVAGFNVQNLGPGQSQVAMRGVSSGQIARDQPGVKEQVGAYLDESVISLSLFTPDMDLFDMSRVEVLRGPQGTLFGSGSESGTVRYISNQPQLGVTQVFGEVGGDSIDGGNQGGDVKFGVNAPLGDTAALRVAGYYNYLAGYIDTPGTQRTANGSIRPDPSTLVTDINTGDRYGVRAAIAIVPNDRLSITPRLVYQKVEADGWNRIDSFNILANPYTTTRPPVTLGERELFAQIGEPFNDKFVLGDLNIHAHVGEAVLTSVTSYTDRDVDVIRDAGALTSSITGGSIGLPEPVYSLNAPLDDHTKAKVFSQELRLSGSKSDFQWVAGGFYAHTKRDYDQILDVAGFEDLTGIPTCGAGPCVFAPKDNLFWSDLHYKLDQFALFGEGTFKLGDRFSVTGGLRYYHFSEDKEQVFDGLFGADGDGNPQSQPGSASANGVAPRVILTYRASDSTNLNAQVSKGFRLGGINDPLNVNLCTPADLVTFGGREAWKDETAWNYEIGSKSRIAGGKGSFNLSAFYIDIKNLQATVTAGSCSSRLVFNVPKSRSIGGEAELSLAPSQHFDFAISAGVHDATLRSTVTSTAADGSVSVVSGIREGNRLPSVPTFQFSAGATYYWNFSSATQGYLTGTYQHVGSRYTQVGDEDLSGSLNLLSYGANTIGAPLTQSTFNFDPKLPAYDIVNLRLGVLRGEWDVALYGNNVTDDRALLSLDRERGLFARVGYLTNQPRTFGVSARVKF